MFGVFLAIRFFANPFSVSSHVNKIHNKQYRHNKPLEFLDLIIQNYSKLLPLIFGKWKKLKDLELDVSLICDVIPPNARLQTQGLNSLSEIKSFNIIFNTFEKQITGEFYYQILLFHFCKLKEKTIKKQLGKEVVIMLNKILDIMSNKTRIDHLDVESKRALFLNDLKKKEEMQKLIQKSHYQISKITI